jgi:hypothetical protein
VLTIAALAVQALAARAMPRCRSGHYAARALAASVTAAACAGLIAYPALAIWYAADPHFFDNAEPTLVSVAWAYLKGAPLYHAVDAAERYSHIYGPMAFLPHAWVLAAWGPSIAASKWLGAIAGLASLGLIYAIARRSCAEGRALALTGVAALALLTFRHYSFWTRPDSLQLFCAALSLYCAGGRGGIAAIVMTGVVSGVLWNLKITGVLYSLPVIVVLQQRAGWRGASLAAAIGAAVAGLPFLLHDVSLANYLTWIRLSGKTGLLLSLLRQNLEWAAFLCLPILLARSLGGRQGGADRNDGRIVQALALGILLVVIAASKPGAGPYHLLPFVPAIVHVTAGRIGRSSLSTTRGLAVEAAIAFVAVLVAVAAAQSAQLVSTMIPRRALDDVEDVRAFLASHPGTVEMAYGQTEARSLIRPILTFRNDTYLLDQPAIREYQLQGLDLPPATIDAVRRCAVAYWLVPRNERPFSGVNGYPSVLLKPLYSDDLRAAFAASHRLTESTKYYDVWKCVGPQQR